MDDLTFFGAVNKLATISRKMDSEHVTDAQLVCFFPTFITQMTIDNIVMWVTQLNVAEMGNSETQTLLETWKIQNQLQCESYVFSDVEHWFPLSWMCKKQASVSHRSTESYIISLDAGLRIDCIPALDLWDVVIEV